MSLHSNIRQNKESKKVTCHIHDILNLLQPDLTHYILNCVEPVRTISTYGPFSGIRVPMQILYHIPWLFPRLSSWTTTGKIPVKFSTISQWRQLALWTEWKTTACTFLIILPSNQNWPLKITLHNRDFHNLSRLFSICPFFHIFHDF